MTITAPVIRYHGGKFRLAPWILAKQIKTAPGSEA